MDQLINGILNSPLPVGIATLVSLGLIYYLKIVVFPELKEYEALKVEYAALVEAKGKMNEENKDLAKKFERLSEEKAATIELPQLEDIPSILEHVQGLTNSSETVQRDMHEVKTNLTAIGQRQDTLTGIMLVRGSTPVELSGVK